MAKQQQRELSPEEQFEQHEQAAQPRSALDDVIDQTQQKRRASLTERAAGVLGVDPKNLFRMLRNVWKPGKDEGPFTDDELAQGLSLVARYELDPMCKEVYVARQKGRLMTIVGIDGWIKILNRTEGYDGFDWEVHFDDNGKLEWVDVTIFSKIRRHPTTYRGYWSEYVKMGGFVAGQMPSHMLRLFSLRHAARLFTPLGANVITEDEARMMRDHVQEEERKEEAPPAKTRTEAARERAAKAKPVETPVEEEPEKETADPPVDLEAAVKERQRKVGLFEKGYEAAE